MNQEISIDLGQVRESAARQIQDSKTILNLTDGVLQLQADVKRLTDTLLKTQADMDQLAGVNKSLTEALDVSHADLKENV